MDYRCGYCRKAYQEIEELVKQDGKVKLILKEYPILGEDSVTSSALCIRCCNCMGMTPTRPRL